MKITRLESIVLRIPYTSGGSDEASAWGGRRWDTADALLVRVETDAGLVGWGEAFGYNAIPATRAVLDDMVAPLIVGRSAEAIEPLMLELQQKLHIFGRGGPVVYALSGLDIALWDLAGKAAGLPVHRLLGGARHAEMPCYASLIRYATQEGVAANVGRALDAGFEAVKLHEIDHSCILAARGAAGPGIPIMLDVNCPWTLGEALRQADLLAEMEPAWLEEPVWPPEDIESLAWLRTRTRVPVAAGENAATVTQFAQMLSSRAVDVLQPSPTKCGGITTLRHVFLLASAANTRVVPHSFYDGPGFLAALHCAAAFQTEPLVEWRFFDLALPPMGPDAMPKDGRIAVPQGPGLGADPDPRVMERYRAA